ncbi:DUF4229 domain-containing protein [Rathayibacter soli]|uniref:DUF4229 domain-containing protein n=1 Tax=Rathayibacter soli TaxID=3144168 RepID=UPI0027E4016F|nr:DUF4229 domain-containing protein [Glaciibacter superstes]
MNAIPHWVTYTALRLLLIIVPLVILMVLGLPWWLSAIIAAVVGLCLSYLLLAGPRHGLARDLDAARKSAKPKASARKRIREDDDVEDHLIDDAVAAEESASASTSERESGAERNSVDKTDDPGQLQH